MRRRLLLGLVSLALRLGLVGVRGADADARARAPAAAAPVVPSLEPKATAALWSRLVTTRPARQQRAAVCRPLRAVFYAATDWLRLATKLAATASPCGEYYVSVPAVVGDKTQPRRDAAWRIRALGPNFHALAEVHFTTWNRWVASTGSTWYAAGVTARERMAAAGYDVALGDSWSLNELSSAVRRGDGNARANIREFLRGLYEGDGSRPTRGAALVVGIGQRTNDLSVYQTNLQNWLTDTAFWADMATYVSDWTQEVYGDVRSFAVPGVALPDRRDSLNDYLQHALTLANAGPDVVEPARTYLREAFSPLANAAWERDSGYGWTMVSADQMASYLSAQVYALRFASAATGQARDHWGFAWAPRNASGGSSADFAAQTGRLLDRLAAAIRDSGESPDPAAPGNGACGPPGQNVWCLGDLEGATLSEGWRSFRAWTQPVLAFATPPQTIPAATPSGPMSLALVTSTGLPVSTTVPLAVTVSSSSASGTFATTPAGPWSAALGLTIAAGTGTSPAFYYQDTRAGSQVLTASASGATSGTQTVTVTAGPLATVVVTPLSATVRARDSRRFAATGADAFGNAIEGSFTWSVTPAVLGTVAPAQGPGTTFIAGRVLRSGTVVASATTGGGTISGTARVMVAPAGARIASIGYRAGQRGVRVTLAVVDGAGRPVSRARVSVLVRRDGRRAFSGRATTGSGGRVLFRVAGPRGCYTTAVRRLSAAGFAWNGRTPRNRFCARPR